MVARASRKGTGPARCPSCSAPTLTQWVGDTAAIQVTAGLTPLTPAQQAEARTPNRLIWCLITGEHRPHRLRWIHAWHPTDCPHPHVTDHQCTAPPTPLF